MGRSPRCQAGQIPLGICPARRLAIIPIAARPNGSYPRDRTLGAALVRALVLVGLLGVAAVHVARRFRPHLARLAEPVVFVVVLEASGEAGGKVLFPGSKHG